MLRGGLRCGTQTQRIMKGNYAMSGKVRFLEERKGVSKKGTAWASKYYVMDCGDGKHLSFFVDSADEEKNKTLTCGKRVAVGFDIMAHEYEGRWFNDIAVKEVRRIE